MWKPLVRFSGVGMMHSAITLAQQFTVDVLYGCAVLRNSSGVQVNT
jgi:hypothetical protein